MPRVSELSSDVSGKVLRTPMIWLGHNLRNKVLLRSDQHLSGSPVLVSFGDAIQRESYKERFFTEGLLDTLGVAGPVMVDSGGFALLNRPQLHCDVGELKRVYDRVPADIVVSLDHPPSTNADKAERSALRRKTQRNYRRLQDIVMPERLMPVLHGHCPEELRRSCDAVQSVCPEPRYVGLGGLVPLLRSGGTPAQFRYRRSDGSLGDRADWVAEALAFVRGRFRNSMVHVFGVGSAVTAIAVMALGADSADSLSWRRAANFGAVLLPGRSERFPTLTPHRARSRPVLSEDDLALLAECGCPVCRSSRSVSDAVAGLARCYEMRAIHNAWTVVSEVAAFRSAIRHRQVTTFVKSRLNCSHRLYRPVMARLR